jgi:hypothetical protein
MSNEATYNLPVAEVKSMPPGASSPQQAALINQRNDAEYQNRVNKLGGRKSKKSRKNKKSRTRKGGGNEIPPGKVEIYSPNVPYKETGTGNQSLTGMNKNVTDTLVQNEANKVYDSKAAIKGGSKKRKQRKSRKSRKTKKSKKTKKHSRKHRK